MGLPSAVRYLLLKLSRQAADHSRELRRVDIDAQIAVARERKRVEEIAEDRIRCANETRSLALARVAAVEEELARAQGREGALWEMIARLKGLRGEADISQAQ